MPPSARASTAPPPPQPPDEAHGRRTLNCFRRILPQLVCSLLTRHRALKRSFLPQVLLAPIKLALQARVPAHVSQP